MARNNNKRYFSGNDNSQQPSRRGFGHARGRRNFTNSSNTSRRPSGQQQQPMTAPTAELFQASKVATLPSHFEGESPKPTQLPEVPVAKTAIAGSLQAALQERAAKRLKVEEKEEK
ncbi:hypothetical protein FCOIX_3986 [Fusarium coicis]|nr:hypothetical protein FCOIX_3986 [Fusarium coicis]